MISPTLATDTVIFNIQKWELKVLLIKMNKEPFIWKWAVPWWFISENELVKDAANRVLFEATNVKDLYLEELKIFDSLDRDPKKRIISVWYMAIIKKDDLNIKTDERYSSIDWFPVESIPALAYDHKEIIDFALERLKREIEYSTISFTLLPKEFTLTDLQKVFEIVLWKELDKRNFRKKILKQKVLKDTGKKRTIWSPRPAVLYKAISSEIKFVEMT